MRARRERRSTVSLFEVKSDDARRGALNLRWTVLQIRNGCSGMMTGAAKSTPTQSQCVSAKRGKRSNRAMRCWRQSNTSTSRVRQHRPSTYSFCTWLPSRSLARRWPPNA